KHRRLPRTLSPSEAERLIDAAAGTTPRSLRDRALVELLYGAGLRVGEALGLTKTDVDFEQRIVRATGTADTERIVPVGRPAAAAGATSTSRRTHTPVAKRFEQPAAGRQLDRDGVRSARSRPFRRQLRGCDHDDAGRRAEVRARMEAAPADLSILRPRSTQPL